MWSYKQSTGFTSGNFLFGAFKLTGNTTDFDQYKYSGYGTEFHARGSFS